MVHGASTGACLFRHFQVVKSLLCCARMHNRRVWAYVDWEMLAACISATCACSWLSLIKSGNVCVHAALILTQPISLSTSGCCFCAETSEQEVAVAPEASGVSSSDNAAQPSGVITPLAVELPSGEMQAAEGTFMYLQVRNL